MVAIKPDGMEESGSIDGNIVLIIMDRVQGKRKGEDHKAYGCGEPHCDLACMHQLWEGKG
jgi:hypothetical protein